MPILWTHDQQTAAARDRRPLGFTDYDPGLLAIRDLRDRLVRRRLRRARLHGFAVGVLLAIVCILFAYLWATVRLRTSTYQYEYREDRRGVEAYVLERGRR